MTSFSEKTGVFILPKEFSYSLKRVGPDAEKERASNSAACRLIINRRTYQCCGVVAAAFLCPIRSVCPLGAANVRNDGDAVSRARNAIRPVLQPIRAAVYRSSVPADVF
jgi:hypothetical protein